MFDTSSDTIHISKSNENVERRLKIVLDTSIFCTMNYGVGKVILNFESFMYSKKDYIVNFYDSFESTSVSEQLIIRWIDENNGYVKAFNDEFFSIRDYHIDEPYYIAQFDCLREFDGYYEVIVDETTKRTMWIKATQDITFKPWADFLKGVVCAVQIDTLMNPVRIEPNIESSICYSKEWCWDIVNIKDQWAQVMFSAIDADLTDEYSREFRGWIKWRDDEEFLIKYYQAI